MSRDVLVGHDTDRTNMTGCTVVVFPEAWPAVVDQRGGAPGTRETDVFAPGRLVRRADAIVLTGGSAFGLAVADGVTRELRRRERGFETQAGPVPIVPAAVIFDLAVGNAVAPDAESGRRALAAAVPLAEADRGAVGAGTGATVAKITGTPRPGGVGIASVDTALGRVTAVMVVNAVGVVGGPDVRNAVLSNLSGVAASEGENTTIGVVVIDGSVSETARRRCAISAHDGMARMIVPCHTISDGDTIFVASRDDGPTDISAILGLCLATELAVERAIADAVAGAE